MFAIDCGNSRIKWARVVDGRVRSSNGATLADIGRAMTALGAALGDGSARVLVANVAGAAAAAAIADTVRDASGTEAEFVQVEANAYGIECGYRDPATLGVDRWLAMIAVRRRVAGAFVVISAGTAVTFDAVDADGRHRGGLILPSDRLMLDSLAEKTQQIGRFPRATAVPSAAALLGRSTEEAVAHGGRLAVAAALDRAVGVAATVIGTKPSVLITGGDADALVPWLESRVDVRADLVLEGLAIVAGIEV